MIVLPGEVETSVAVLTGADWLCPNCEFVEDLDTHGRCPGCGSEVISSHRGSISTEAVLIRRERNGE